jgi:hypothetical protein
VFHLPWLENPALWVDQRNAFAPELETARKTGGIQNSASQSSKPVYVVESRLTELSITAGGVHCLLHLCPTSPIS